METGRDAESGGNPTTRAVRHRELRPVGRVSRAFGLAYGALTLVACVGGGVRSTGVDPFMLLFAVPSAAVVIRSCMVGLKVRGSELIIVSWFRTYRFHRDRIGDAILIDYSGWFANLSPSRRIKILELEVDGRDRELSCTAMTRRGAARATAELARAFDLQARDLDEIRVPMPELGRWGNG